jgi:lysophospholipase L1-like esterase
MMSIVLMAATVTGSATAQGTSDSIWCGLWSGSNFDIESSCPARSTTPSDTGGGTTTPSTPAEYAALGDSVAAGIGLPAGAYTTARDRQCGRSGAGYPNLVANALNLKLTNVACSGATAGDLITKQGVEGPNIPAQLDTAFANGTPKLITITAGANDVLWSRYVQACLTTDCTGLLTFPSVAKLKLNAALADIYLRSNGNPPMVILTGYYNPFSGACAAQYPQVTNAEINWLINQNIKLNQAIREAANNYSFVRFIPIDFSGHDMCAADPWVQKLDDPAPIHPTARGQAAIAKAILDVAATIEY